MAKKTIASQHPVLEAARRAGEMQILAYGKDSDKILHEQRLRDDDSVSVPPKASGLAASPQTGPTIPPAPNLPPSQNQPHLTSQTITSLAEVRPTFNEEHFKGASRDVLAAIISHKLQGNLSDGQLSKSIKQLVGGKLSH